MIQSKWNFIESKNLADIRFQVLGRNEEDLLLNITQAFLAMIINLKNIKEEKEVSIKISGSDFSEIIFNFINELIFQKDVKLLLFKSGSFRLTFLKNGVSLFAELRGQRIRKNTKIKSDIKTLILDKSKVEKKEKGLQATLVFDN